MNFKTPRTPFQSLLRTCLLAVTLTFGEVNVITTKQNIILKTCGLLFSSAFSVPGGHSIDKHTGAGSKVESKPPKYLSKNSNT